MRKRHCLFGAFIAAVSLASTAASAAMVTIYFSGTVNNISSDLSGTPLVIGTSQITGSITFDDNAVATSMTSSGSDFPYIAAEMTAAGQSFVSPATAGSIFVANDQLGTDAVSATANGPAGSGIDFFGFVVEGRPPTLFGAETLAEVIAWVMLGDLSGAPGRLIRVITASGSGALGVCDTSSCFINARLDRLSLTPPDEIPVPAALPLFLAGLAGLGLARRRRAAA